MDGSPTLQPQKATEYPTCVLLHGFPQLWYGWKYQIQHLHEKGYRVIAPDLRGYGGSDAPPDASSYDVFTVTQDMLGLLQQLHIPNAVFIGHEIGAVISYFIALYRPHIVRGICGLSAPHIVCSPTMSPLRNLENDMGPRFHYVLYHNEKAAEREYDARPEVFLRRLYSLGSVSCESPVIMSPYRAAGDSFIDRLGEPIALPCWLEAADLEYFVQNFRKRGFAGPVHYFRNFMRNWKHFLSLKNKFITQPSTIVLGEADPTLEYYCNQKHMLSKMTSSLKNPIETSILPNTGHFLHWEKADLVNSKLDELLKHCI